MGEFRKSVKAFEEAADWLGAEDAPALAALYAMADKLDEGEVQAALLGQFGLAHRGLLKRAPKADEEDTDPLAAALKDAEGA